METSQDLNFFTKRKTLQGQQPWYMVHNHVLVHNHVPINYRASPTRDVTGLDKSTEYEFQVLAFTSVSDGPKSSVEVVRTKDGVKNYQYLMEFYFI